MTMPPTIAAGLECHSNGHYLRSRPLGSNLPFIFISLDLERIGCQQRREDFDGHARTCREEPNAVMRVRIPANCSGLMSASKAQQPDRHNKSLHAMSPAPDC